MKMSQFLKEPAIIAGILGGILTGLYFMLLAYQVVPFYQVVHIWIIIFSVLAGRFIGKRLKP